MSIISNKIEKIKKMSKILDVILKITAIMIITGIAASSVITVAAPSLDLDNFKLAGMWGRTVALQGDVDEFRVVMIAEALNGAVVAAILFMASFIFKNISRGGSPFTQKNANRLKIISLLLIALSAVIPPLHALVSLVMLSSVSSLVVYFNFTYAIFAAVFFCLALIFEYGAELQQQADETL